MANDARWMLFEARDFDRARDAWQQAAARNRASAAVGADFVGSLLDVFADGNEVVAIRDGGGGPDAAAVLCSPRPGVWTTFNPSETCVGLWIQAAGAELSALASELLRALPGMPIALAVLQQDPAIVPRPPRSSRVRTMDHFRTAWIEVVGSFEDYWAARGKNLRSNIKKARAELGRMGVSPTLDVVTTEAGVEAAIAEYARLEAAGWKGKSGTALAPENLQGQFYRQALARACRRGQGEIHRYCLGDSAVAMDLCLRDGATLIVLKTAYDEAFAKFSPASLMREEQLRRLFAGGVTRRVEFYGPVMDWHTRWTQDARMLYHVNCYRLPLLSWVHDLSVARRKRAPARPGAVV